MNTVERLERAIEDARRLGYRIRHEWLQGQGGGACEISGVKWVFIDLALTTAEQLDLVAQAIGEDVAKESAMLGKLPTDLSDNRKAA